MFKKKINQYQSEGKILSYIDESVVAVDMLRTHRYLKIGDIYYDMHNWNTREKKRNWGIGKKLFKRMCNS